MKSANKKSAGVDEHVGADPHWNGDVHIWMITQIKWKVKGQR